MRGRTPSCLAVGAAVALVATGCTSEPIVSGSVSVDQKPLQMGSISFYPIGETGGPASGTTITEGQYRVSKGLSEGEYRIEIQGTRVDPTRKEPEPFGNHLIPAEVQVVPPEYNQQSTLVRTIEAGKNTFNFDLNGF